VEAEKWTPDQISALQPKLDRVRQAVIQLFDHWLYKQRILKAQQTGDFRRRMLEQCGKISRLSISQNKTVNWKSMC